MIDIRFLLKTVDYNPFICEKPFKRQAEFLSLQCLEAFYGGAAGPGKSSALLSAALQYAQCPDYAALILRRTYPELRQPGALMDRAEVWLRGKAQWSGERNTWLFPSGASLSFGYCEHDRHLERYQSGEYQFIGIDEVGEFTERQYLFFFSRLRKNIDSKVPLRMRSASNPGTEWVKQRFVNPGTDDIPFIKALIDDNPYLNTEEYIQNLNHLDPFTRERLLKGDWDVKPEGGLFKSHWFQVVDDYPSDLRKVRYWDLAGTQGAGDWTVGTLIGEKGGVYWVLDVKRERLSPQGVERLVKNTASNDGVDVWVVIEQEPGSSGKSTIDYYRRHVLKGFSVKGDKVTGSKVERARPLSSATEAGNVKVLRAKWNKPLFDEADMFPEGDHDDQVDTLSGGHQQLSQNKPIKIRIG